MQIVPTTIVALIAALAILRIGPCRGTWIFFALTPLGVASAINLPAVGGASIVLADAAAMTLFGLLLIRKGALGRIFGTMQPPSPGFFLLVLFVYMFFATIFFPRVFEGQTEVFGIARIADQPGVIIAVPLHATSGNLTQLFRISLGVMVFITMDAVFRREPRVDIVVKAMAANVIVHCLFGVLDVATFNLGVTHWLDVIRTANYAMAYNQVMAGLKRMVGGFPEASAFGYHTLGVFGFWLQYWFDKGQFRYAGLFVVMIVIVLVLSTSSSAYVAALLFLVIFVLFNSGRFLTRTINFRVAGILGGLAAFIPVFATMVIVLYNTTPGVAEYFDRMLLNKMESNSAEERMSWNVQALQNFADTWMVGTGLGSVRASNWLISCLASIGVLGTLLYLIFFVSIFRSRSPEPSSEMAIVIRALKLGCLALMTRALITKATPNLELTFYAMAGLIAGLSASAAMARRPTETRRKNEPLLRARSSDATNWAGS